MNECMQAVEIQGVRSWIEKNAAATRDAAQPGSYDVDVMFHLVGKVNVGFEGETTEVTKADADRIVAALLDQMTDKQRAKALNKVASLFHATLEPQVSEASAVEAKSLVAVAQRKRQVPRRGSVTAKVTLERVGEQAEVYEPFSVLV